MTVRSVRDLPAASPSPLQRRGGPDAWHARQHEVIDRARGVCALCGLGGADTAFRHWTSDDLLAAHTRCVLGLGPPGAHPGPHAA